MKIQLHIPPLRYPLQVPHDRLLRLATEVVDRLVQAGFQAYLVGGSIRDLVMGRHPSDYDITTNAHPQQVTALFDKTLPVGIEFGTVIVLKDHEPFEVTTFRTDGRYLDGRRPDSVEFGTVIDDVQRRDFTVNGLLYDPHAEEVIDYVGGMKHIEEKLITTIGSPRERFGEDRLRMLRAVRFASKLGFAIEQETFDAIREMAPHISDVSVERIHQELMKLLVGQEVARGSKAMADSGLLQHVVPFAVEHEALDRRMQRLQALEHRSGALGLATWVAELEEEQIEELFEHLRFSNAERKQTLTYLRHVHLLPEYPQMREADRKRWARHSDVNDVLLLAEILDEDGSLKDCAAQVRADLSEWTQASLAPSPFLNGHDLRLMGLKAGPIFKQILQELETEHLEGRLTTEEEARQWVETTFPEHFAS
jgi:poly(A) polymerase